MDTVGRLAISKALVVRMWLIGRSSGTMPLGVGCFEKGANSSESGLVAWRVRWDEMPKAYWEQYRVH